MTPPSGADAWLVDDRWSKAYPLGDDTSMGRGSESTIILRDPGVSRHHADVKKEAGVYVLHAFGASGTKLNGVPVESACALREGDVVEIAFAALRFTTMAPTGEMFVIPRDNPTPIDRQEGPTRVTLQSARPTLDTIWRRHRTLILVAVFLLAALAFFIAPASIAR